MRLTKDFDLSEFHCKSGALVPDNLVANVHNLCLRVLQPVRDAFGKPLVVVSGYRDPLWNQKVGGARFSQHMSGQAADIQPLTPSETPYLIGVVEELIYKGALTGLGGMGKYPLWVHLDIHKAPDGHLRRWSGKGLGSEP